MRMAKYETFRATDFFSCLDGLRCLAILAVVWHHAGVHPDGINLTQSGHLGVDLFFAISGFLITTLLLRERDKWGRISIRDFYIRRTLRIFPLYYAVIVLYVIAVWALEKSPSVRSEFFANLPYFLTYTSNWFIKLDGRVIFYFAWSLATEEQFYLLWPTIERLLRGWRAVGLIIILLLARLLIQHFIASGALLKEQLAVVIFLSIHPAILGGVVMAHLLHDQRTFDTISVVIGARWASLAILAALMSSIEFLLREEIVWALMVLLVGSVAIRESNGLGPLLRWRPVAHIGLVSYGMYLMHMLCYNAVKRMLLAAGFDHAWLLFPATVIAATLAATLSYRYYESWFLRIKHRFERTRTRQTGTLKTPG
jgi:peptidoglycan/LPS O-acetylase OafA/YrhL